MDILLLLFLGSFVGLVAGMFGIGGSGMLVPVLTSMFIAQGFSDELALHSALGTGMATVLVTSLSSSLTHHKAGFVMWRYFALIAPGVVIGGLVGSSVAVRVNHIFVALFFSFFMFCLALKLFIEAPVKARELKPLPNFAQSICGVVIGSIASLISIGGGALTVPYLTFQGFDIKKAIGTSAAVSFAVAIGGVLGYILGGLDAGERSGLWLGNVNVIYFAVISLMSFSFAPVGAKITHMIKGNLIKKLFSIFLFLLSVRMVYSLL